MSIEYLETYRNAGVLEVWLGAPPPHVDVGAAWRAAGADGGGDHRSVWSARAALDAGAPHKSLGAQRSAAARGAAAGPLSRRQSASVLIDTLNDGRRVSEYRVRTVEFGAYGQQLVHLRHSSEQLNASEVARRGGDKVKVVGIRAC